MIFGPNELIKVGSDNILIEKYINEGGQGEVYQVKYHNDHYALKIYLNQVEDDDDDGNYLIDNIEDLVKKGRPNENFIWPLEMFVMNKDGKSYFTYIMDLINSCYFPFSDYINGKRHFKTLSSKINWGNELVISFKKLHEKGYCYKDISENNLFFDPLTGDLKICDIDNITPSNYHNSIIGTPKYTAPELINQDFNSGNEIYYSDNYTDRYSIAVTLFYLFFNHSPFEGELYKAFCKEKKSIEEFYNLKPPYIFSESDSSNQTSNFFLKKKYKFLPDFMKESFQKSFSEFTDREDRVSEVEWIKLLYKYKAGLYKSLFNIEAFYSNKKSLENVFGLVNNFIPVLYINKNGIALQKGKIINRAMIDKYTTNYNELIGIVVKDSKDKNNKLKIKLNLSNFITTKDRYGKEKVISPTGYIPVIDGLKIKFDQNIIGQVKYKWKR